MTDSTVSNRVMGPAYRSVPAYRPAQKARRPAREAAPSRACALPAADKHPWISVVYAVAALALLVAIAPMMAAIAAAIYARDRGPVFFVQNRIGLGGRPFKCLKFRSMCVDAEHRLAEHLAADPTAHAEWRDFQKLRNDPRITPFGKFLRRSSLDELPQLINVIRGDMSIVGPRPIVEDEIPKYSRRFKYYASVKPGITGLWQINGRNETTYRARVALDCLYASRRGPLLDLFILSKTIPVVLSRRGSY